MYIKESNQVPHPAHLTWDDMLSCKVPPPDFIVENLIPRRGVTLITGEGGIGKSFLLIELARSVASGQPFLGRFKCAQGPVLYIDLENDNTIIAQRVRKITAAHNQNSPTLIPKDESAPNKCSPLRVGESPEVRSNALSISEVSSLPANEESGEIFSQPSTPHSPLNDESEEVPHSDLIPHPSMLLSASSASSAVNNMQLPVSFLQKQDLSTASIYINEENGKHLFRFLIEKHKPTLILIDPLTGFHSADENDNVTMRRLISYIQRVAWSLNGAVVIVHHPRKRGMINDAGQMIRGASDLRNAVDSHLFLRRVSRHQVLVEHDKSRQCPEVERFRIEIKDSDDGTATFIRYVEKAKEGSSKIGRAKESIVSLLHTRGSLRFTNILEELGSSDIPEATLRHALRDLVRSGQVDNPEWGLYVLSE